MQEEIITAELYISKYISKYIKVYIKVCTKVEGRHLELTCSQVYPQIGCITHCCTGYLHSAMQILHRWPLVSGFWWKHPMMWYFWTSSWAKSFFWLPELPCVVWTKGSPTGKSLTKYKSPLDLEFLVRKSKMQKFLHFPVFNLRKVWWLWHGSPPASGGNLQRL